MRIKRCKDCRVAFHPKCSQVRCAACQRQEELRGKRVLYYKNKELYNKRSKEYYWNNHEQQLKRLREYHIKNRDYFVKYMVNYHNKQREKLPESIWERIIS